MRNGKEWRWRPLVFFFFVSRAPSSDFVAVEFGEFAQHRQRVDEPLAQDRLAAVARDVAQSVRAALALAVDVRHQVAAVGAVVAVSVASSSIQKILDIFHNSKTL